MGTIKNAIMNLIGRDTNVDPDKAILAYGKGKPEIGKRYSCMTMEIDEETGELIFRDVVTPTVENVRRIAKNIFVLTTRKAYFVVRSVNMFPEDTHFAVIREKPEAWKVITCEKAIFFLDRIEFRERNILPVWKIEEWKGLYKLLSDDGTFICLPLF